ncbi:hypothetical protein TSUD_253970 [Trifolium subterraneum]|uniref:Uncharacterized protein n=1 Tax=Trifolium subterraneum TaxID=3900 RepID=A0A2Z6NNL3_TRISU|nr:hypothetical protein TSUD_253970 [Trifolium subterraneum]
MMCLMTSGIGHKVDDDDSVIEEEYERHLNLINKARDTSIQRKPSFERKINETSVKISQPKSIHWLEKVSCPKETVPI